MVIGTNNEITMESTIKELSPAPLFHQPLVIDGKRVRRQVTKFDSGKKQAHGTNVRATKGKGASLKDIKKIKQELDQLEPTKLKVLHKLLFGVAGKPSSLKERIFQFKGFSFSIGSREYEKKTDALNNMLDVDLRMINKVLGLGPSIAADQMISNVMKLLMAPKSSIGIKKRNNVDKKTKMTDDKMLGPSKPVISLRLSESSSDGEHEEIQDENQKIEIPTAKKPKKHVTFEDMVNGDPQLNVGR